MNRIRTTTIATMLCFTLFISAQESSRSDPDEKITYGFGSGIGYFNPKGVNNYIENFIEDKTSGMTVTTKDGFTEIFLFFTLRGFVSYEVAENTYIDGFLEGGWAPKLITINSEMYTFAYWRLTPGAVASYHIPLEDENDINLGVGLLYNFYKFKEITGNGINYRTQIGFKIPNDGNPLNTYLAVDFASPDGEFKFSRVTFGCDFGF
ncbi:MAG: hypothetical protein JXB49_01855 [Bacteroidales bacterium]|nr:hypothetical protein [Bacteroidales bacterium]